MFTLFKNCSYFNLFFILLIPVLFSAESSAQNDNVEIVKGLYEAFATGDIPTVLAGLDENVEWNEAESNPYGVGNPYRGPDAVLNGVFKRLGEEWEYYNLEDKNYYEVENNMVLVTGRYQGKFKANGNLFDAQFAHLWWFKDGKPIKFQQYTDTEQIHRVMND